MLVKIDNKMIDKDPLVKMLFFCIEAPGGTVVSAFALYTVALGYWPLQDVLVSHLGQKCLLNIWLGRHFYTDLVEQ